MLTLYACGSSDDVPTGSAEEKSVHYQSIGKIACINFYENTSNGKETLDLYYASSGDDGTWYIDDDLYRGYSEYRYKDGFLALMTNFYNSGSNLLVSMNTHLVMGVSLSISMIDSSLLFLMTRQSFDYFIICKLSVTCSNLYLIYNRTFMRIKVSILKGY